MTGGGQPGGQTLPRRGQAWARARVASGPTLAPLTPPLRLFILLFGKTLEIREILHEKFCSRRHQRTRLGRVLELFPAPCRREKSPPEAFFIAMPASAMMCVVGMIYGYPTVVPRFRQARVAHRGAGGTKPIGRPSCCEDVRCPAQEQDTGSRWPEARIGSEQP